MTALASLTWPQTADHAHTAPTLAVPVGATEQHGPHLPLSTDTDIAVALATRLAITMPDIVVAPPLAYGSSGEHQDFPGTVSIGQAALERLLVELVRSAGRTFPHIVLISTHGGNAQPVTRAVRLLLHEGRNVLAWSPNWGGGDAHAGRTETSLMLTLAPQHVRMHAAQAGNTTPISGLLPRLHREGLAPVTANGVLGDPTGASAEEGAALLRHATTALTQRVAEHRRRVCTAIAATPEVARIPGS
jgi:creatinine amidohydrolase